MACSETQKLVAEYLGGEMTVAQRTACEYHFSVCEDCRQAVDGLAGTAGRLLHWEQVTVPDWDRTASTAEEVSAQKTRPEVVPLNTRSRQIPGGWQSWLPLAATVALAVFLGWNQDSGLSEQELTAYLDAFEQRQQAQTQRIMETAMQEFGDSTSDSMAQLVEWIQAQRTADMQQLEASFQQMLNHDYQALSSMQQLASWVSTQEP